MTNPIAEAAALIPAQYRKYVYVLATVALFIYALWEVAAGDVKTFLVSLASALVSGLAAANTPASPAEVEEKAVELIEDELEATDSPYDENYPF